MLRRLLICFAFASWCFLNSWVELAEGKSAYLARYNPLHTVALPVICCELVLALGVYGLWELWRWRGWQSPFWYTLFLASCLIPLGIASVALLRLAPVELIPIVRKPQFWPITLILAIVPLTCAVWRPRRASRLLGAMFLYLWPVLTVVYLVAWRNVLRYTDCDYVDRPQAAAIHASVPRIRVVWIIFDELSQAITFNQRPAGLSLTNLDRLKDESFYATAAHSPADLTQLSLPALILGQTVAEATAQGPDDLLVRTTLASEARSWGNMPNLFDDARALGLNTAVAGSFHPYGRLLNRSLTKCYWTAGWLLSGIEEPFEPLPLWSAMWRRVRLQFSALPLAGHLPGVFPGIHQRRDKIRRFVWLAERSRELVGTPP